MSDYCMIESAFDNKEELNNVVNELLEKKLVASCQVMESNSSWNWKNERESAKEYLLQMKTKKRYAKEIYEVIKEKHSYECFEFAIYDISSINKEYLNWIDNELKNIID